MYIPKKGDTVIVLDIEDTKYNPTYKQHIGKVGKVIRVESLPHPTEIFVDILFPDKLKMYGALSWRVEKINAKLKWRM